MQVGVLPYAVCGVWGGVGSYGNWGAQVLNINTVLRSTNRVHLGPQKSEGRPGLGFNKARVKVVGNVGALLVLANLWEEDCAAADESLTLGKEELP